MSVPTSILFVANSDKIGGGNRVLMDLMTSLSPRDYRSVLVTPADGPMSSWARGLDIRTYAVRDGDWSGTAALLRRTAALIPVLLKERIRLVHAGAHDCYRGAGVAASIAGAHRICHLGFPPTPDELRWAFRMGPDVVVACHDSQARAVAPVVASIRPDCRVVAVPNGIDTNRFSWTDRNRSRWRFGAKYVVLVVGHLSDVKGYPTFLEAARLLTDIVGNDCAFVALGGVTIGGEDYERGLKARAEALGIGNRVHFLGWQPAVPEILSAADVMVLPSRMEGLPLAVLEAMACARPVVATRVGGTPEAVVDGVTGILVEPDQPAALGSALATLLRDPERASAMGQEGRRRVEQLFSVKRVVSEIDRIYRDLLIGPVSGGARS